MKPVRLDTLIQPNLFTAPAQNGGAEVRRNHALERLAGLEKVYWLANDPDDFTFQYRKLEERAAGQPELMRMLDLHLLASALSDGPRSDAVPHWADSWLETCLDIPALSGGPDMARLRNARWRRVCFPVHKDLMRGGRIRWIMAGCLPGSSSALITPAWLSETLPPESMDAARNAAAAVFGRRRTGLVWFPLTVDPVRGRSFSLALALAFRALREKESLHPASIAATGIVDSEGRLHPVGHMAEKRGVIRQKKFHLFLRPQGGDPVPASDDCKLLEMAVTTLDEAWIMARLYAPGRRRELGRFLEMLRDPGRFVRDAGAVPAEWLCHARKQGRLDQVARRVRQDPALFLRMTDLFERCVKESRNDTATALADLFSGDRAVDPEAAPLSAFRWASLQVGMWNHRGDVVRAESWARQAEHLLPKALPCDMDAVADAVNYQLVYRHNRYHFDPEPPPEFARILAALEARHKVQQDFGCKVDLTLGAFYGTLGQNYAFCGPAYLDQSLEVFEQTCLALGYGVSPENAPHWRRTCNYMTYALLDAGPDHAGKARDCLCASLDLPAPEQAHTHIYTHIHAHIIDERHRFSRWDHALFVRWLADTPDSAALAESWHDIYGSVDGAGRPPSDAEHPWQLWQLNMGRVARSLGRTEAAIRHFRSSLELCRHPDAGPSIRVMALLPLSALVEENAVSGMDMAAVENEFREAVACLHRPHFADLLDDNFPKILEKIHNDPARWFPFNHR